MFVEEVSANKGEEIITIWARGEILREAEFGPTFLDDCAVTCREQSQLFSVCAEK
jgi:hypothetical protein